MYKRNRVGKASKNNKGKEERNECRPSLFAEKLREGIHELTTNPIYKENVKKMSAELQNLGGAYAAEKVMEFMANRA